MWRARQRQGRWRHQQRIRGRAAVNGSTARSSAGKGSTDLRARTCATLGAETVAWWRQRSRRRSRRSSVRGGSGSREVSGAAQSAGRRRWQQTCALRSQYRTASAAVALAVLPLVGPGPRPAREAAGTTAAAVARELSDRGQAVRVASASSRRRASSSIWGTKRSGGGTSMWVGAPAGQCGGVRQRQQV